MKNNFNKITGFLKQNSLTILTVTVSILTLMIYVRQTNILSKQTEMLLEQSKASSWPYLSIGADMSFDDENMSFGEYRVIVANFGVGPAIIEKVVIKVKDKEFSNWDEFTQHFFPDNMSKKFTRHSLYDRVIMPGDMVTVIDLHQNLPMADHLYKKDVLKNLEIMICYKSVYNDYWMVSCKDFSSLKKSNISRSQSTSCQLKAKTYFMN